MGRCSRRDRAIDWLVAAAEPEERLDSEASLTARYDIDFHFHPIYSPVFLRDGDLVIVCHCRATSDREIRRSVRNGAVTLREVSSACGAASGCGGCAEAVREVIASELGAFEPRTLDVDLASAR